MDGENVSFSVFQLSWLFNCFINSIKFIKTNLTRTHTISLSLTLTYCSSWAWAYKIHSHCIRLAAAGPAVFMKNLKLIFVVFSKSNLYSVWFDYCSKNCPSFSIYMHITLNQLINYFEFMTRIERRIWYNLPMTQLWNDFNINSIVLKTGFLCLLTFCSEFDNFTLVYYRNLATFADKRKLDDNFVKIMKIMNILVVENWKISWKIWKIAQRTRKIEKKMHCSSLIIICYWMKLTLRCCDRWKFPKCFKAVKKTCYVNDVPLLGHPARFHEHLYFFFFFSTSAFFFFVYSIIFKNPKTEFGQQNSIILAFLLFCSCGAEFMKKFPFIPCKWSAIECNGRNLL